MIFLIWFRKNIVLEYLMIGEKTTKWPKSQLHGPLSLGWIDLTYKKRILLHQSMFVLGPVIIRQMRSCLGDVRSKCIPVRRNCSATRYNICVYDDVRRADPAKCERALNTYFSLSDRFVQYACTLRRTKISSHNCFVMNTTPR